MRKRTSAFDYFIHSDLFRGLIALEFLIVFLFALIWDDLEPLSSRHLEKTTICVDQINFVSAGKSSDLVVIDDGISYYFTNGSGSSEYTVYELRDLLQIDDELHITYYVGKWKMGLVERNVIVEAHTDTQVLRTIEGYNERKNGLRPFTLVMFILVELLYSGGVFGFFWRNRYIFRRGKKKKKNAKKKQIKGQQMRKTRTNDQEH